MTAYIESDGLRLRRKVRALVLNENDEVLLVRPHGYRDGEWTLAGGGVEEGESPVEAMRRELAEELGVGLEAELSELPVTNRFIYSAEHKVKRNLDHDDYLTFPLKLRDGRSELRRCRSQSDPFSHPCWPCRKTNLVKRDPSCSRPDPCSILRQMH